MNRKTPTCVTVILLALTACTQQEKPSYEPEPITRRAADFTSLPLTPHSCQSSPSYPWDRQLSERHVHITKEFFRCRGSRLNPLRLANSEAIVDCAGGRDHSLPIRDGKEEIYPVLLELLNFLQDKTGCRVRITCGHRCPSHNAYCDDSQLNRTSKHLIGAEVDFYLEGLQDQPELVIAWIQEYYRERSGYNTWTRYEQGDTNVSTPPWYNREVFLKLFKADEGRDFDNCHPYPYISIQVRYDRYRKQRVYYTWKEAFYGYAR